MKLRAYLTLAGLALAHAAQAAVIYSENFDSLNAGTLAGQGGWTLNTAGTNTVVNDPAEAYSSPNFLTLGASGAVQHTYGATSLSAEATTFSFYFLSTTTAAGHNVQLSLRTATSGSGSVFYLNLLGSGAGLQAGTGASSYSSYTFSSGLVVDSWYLFSATTDPLTSALTFSVTPAAGGASLTSGTVDLSGTQLVTERLVFSSNSSTAAGDWAIDNITFASVPEPGTAALALGGLGLIALGCRRLRGPGVHGNSR